MTDNNLSNNELGTIQPCLKTGDELFLNAEGHTNSLKDYWAMGTF